MFALVVLVVAALLTSGPLRSEASSPAPPPPVATDRPVTPAPPAVTPADAAGAPGAAGAVADGRPDDAASDDLVTDAAVDTDELAALQAQIEALTGEVEALRELTAGLAAQLSSMSRGLHSYRLPETLDFAGRPVPLDRWDVAERLEREFYLALGAPAQVLLWLKRSARYFPYIEGELRAAGLPDDLKYVAVVESALQPRAYSWAHASGLWQFIADTARRYRLTVTDAWDERRDEVKSTAAAIAYLEDLHAMFGDWPLALAAYNSGESRVAAALKRQGVSEYYQLALPAETERYVFRVLAAKLILEDPTPLGFAVPDEARYAPHATDVVGLRVVGHLRVQELAAAAGSFYREIRALNPAIMSTVLPAGRYEVRILEGRTGEFRSNLPDLERRMAARAVRRVEYRVKDGDTLTGIARRFGVSIDALKKWNRAARRPHIYPGDRLVIERAARHTPKR